MKLITLDKEFFRSHKFIAKTTESCIELVFDEELEADFLSPNDIGYVISVVTSENALKHAGITEKRLTRHKKGLREDVTLETLAEMLKTHHPYTNLYKAILDRKTILFLDTIIYTYFTDIVTDRGVFRVLRDDNLVLLLGDKPVVLSKQVNDEYFLRALKANVSTALSLSNPDVKILSFDMEELK